MKNKKTLIETVLQQIVMDVHLGDSEALEELLSFLPTENLIAYLPEEDWSDFEHLIKNIGIKKNKIIHDIVYNLMENVGDSQQYIKDLLIEALSTRTLEDLKEINA